MICPWGCSDLRNHVANAALMLLSDGCDALDAVEKHVFNLSGPVKL